MPNNNPIQRLIRDFADSLSAAIEGIARTNAISMVEAALGAGGKGAPKLLVGSTGVGGMATRKRRKGPIQLCPAPGCKNPAAPVFGMLCRDHKGAPKAKVKKWREARKAAKAKAKGKKA